MGTKHTKTSPAHLAKVAKSAGQQHTTITSANAIRRAMQQAGSSGKMPPQQLAADVPMSYNDAPQGNFQAPPTGPQPDYD